MILKRRHTYTVLAFILLIILSLSSLALAEGMICRTFPDDEEQRAAQFDHTELLSPSVTQNLSYGELALARIVCGNDLYYVREDGRHRRVLSYDNGHDYFSDGLVRFEKDNKVGFMNSMLEDVIPASFTYAFPFDNGIAITCTGCSQVKDGEHRHFLNGEWRLINKSGAYVNASIYASYRQAYEASQMYMLETAKE